MLILHTASLHKYGLNRIFEFAKAAGYDGLEIGVDKANYDTQNAEYLKQLSEAHQMPIMALHAPTNGAQKSVEHTIRMAEFLGCPMVVITPPRLLDFKFTSWLKKEVPGLRKKKNIQIALANANGNTILGFLPERALNNLEALKKFGMVALDTSSTVSKKWDLMRIYEHLRKLVVHIHLSNVRYHREYSLPNEGILPLESLLKKLKKDNFKGAISVLVRPSELNAGDDLDVVKKLKHVKKFVEEYFA